MSMGLGSTHVSLSPLGKGDTLTHRLATKSPSVDQTRVQIVYVISRVSVMYCASRKELL